MAPRIRLPRVPRVLALASLLLNAAFIASASYVVHRKGGLDYLRRYRDILADESITIESFPPFYQQQYSYFLGHPLAAGQTVFIGDSLTEGFDLERWFPGEPSLSNRGIGSDNTVGVLFRLDEVLRSTPHRIMLLIGISDLRIGRSPERIAATILRFVERTATGSPTTNVVLQSVLPINRDLFGREIDPEDILSVNTSLELMASDYERVEYLDLSQRFSDDEGRLRSELTLDGVHLNEEGYRTYRDAIAGVVTSYGR